jgi:Holliday junction DNA helicase RuvA
MFNSLTGILTFKSKERAFLMLSGIEWDISITATTSTLLPQEGETCTLYTYLNHREDKMQLFGFSTKEERALFFDLIKVESIGTASAIKILSGIASVNLVKAIDSEDATLLGSIPGIGKKTAEKIIFKLKGKISSPQEEPLHEDIAKGLSGMGFDLKESREAVRSAAKTISSSAFSRDDFEKELFKAALKLLGK